MALPELLNDDKSLTLEPWVEVLAGHPPVVARPNSTGRLKMGDLAAIERTWQHALRTLGWPLTETTILKKAAPSALGRWRTSNRARCRDLPRPINRHGLPER